MDLIDDKPGLTHHDPEIRQFIQPDTFFIVTRLPAGRIRQRYLLLDEAVLDAAPLLDARPAVHPFECGTRCCRT